MVVSSWSRWPRRNLSGAKTLKKSSWKGKKKTPHHAMFDAPSLFFLHQPVLAVPARALERTSSTVDGTRKEV